MARQKHSTLDIENALIQFVSTSTDLRSLAYTAFAKARQLPSQSVIYSHYGRAQFHQIVWPVAQQHGDRDRVYRWATCPNGGNHAAISSVYSTINERESGQCAECDRADVERIARVAAMPTFAERYPYAVQWLASPADADSKHESVTFRCSTCSADCEWAPKVSDVPLCHYCRTVGGRQPGDTIPRTGGARAKLEQDVADHLIERHGLPVATGMGIVIPRNAIVVVGRFGPFPLPAVKPDLVHTVSRTAIEIDIGGYHFRHDQPQYVSQDRTRNRVLGSVGWRCLRVREPGWPTVGDPEFTIETTSSSARTIAELIAERLCQPGS